MISGQASLTAQRVAAQRLTFDRLPTPYGQPDADDRLARDVAGDVGDASGPLTDYLRARTAFFDRVAVRAVGSGVRQVVVLAAGYDGRSMRYATPGVRWFEVDHPATQGDKLERLTRLGIASDATYLPADFTVDDVAGVLATAGQDPTAATLFLCEGVAVYLEPPVLERLLAAARARAAPGSRLAISLSVSGAASDRRREFQETVARLGEPTRNVMTPDDAADLFESTGWRTVDPGDAGDRIGVAGLVLVEAAGFEALDSDQ